MDTRLVVMMPAADKRAIEARARDHGLTPSELVRRAARDWAPADPAEEDALALLADELTAAVAGIRADISSALLDLDSHRAQMAMLRAGD